MAISLNDACSKARAVSSAARPSSAAASSVPASRSERSARNRISTASVMRAPSAAFRLEKPRGARNRYNCGHEFERADGHVVEALAVKFRMGAGQRGEDEARERVVAIRIEIARERGEAAFLAGFVGLIPCFENFRHEGEQ